MSEVEHIVTLRSRGLQIENWTSYSISCDMLTVADQFELQLGPADPIGEEFGAVWAAVKPDSRVEVFLDDVPIVTGYIDDRTGTSTMQGDTIDVSGRDIMGRLLDESAPLISFRGLQLDALALKVGAPWVQAVSFDNSKNRNVVTGRGRGAKGGRVFREPGAERTPRVYRKVEPGETKWGVLEFFLRENELLAWSAADGRTLIIGQPNYDQEPTFRFFHPAANSPREQEGNCASFTVRDSVGERYSQIIAMGANAGNARDYAEKVVHRKGVALDGEGPGGIGADFQHRKLLMLADDAIRNDKQAQVRALREMAERDANGHEVTLTVHGHSQLLAGARAPTLYACDTMAHVQSEVFGVDGLYLITSARFHRTRAEATTELRLVPKGTLLRA